MKYLAILLTVSTLALGGFACKDKDSHEKHEYKSSDGTVVTEEKTKKTNDEGDSTVTTEKKVDRP